MNKILGKYEKCPKCGKKDGLFLTKRYLVTKFLDISGKEFIWLDEHSKNYQPSDKELVMLRNIGEENDDDPTYIFNCEHCGWYSHPYDEEGNDLLGE